MSSDFWPKIWNGHPPRTCGAGCHRPFRQVASTTGEPIAGIPIEVLNEHFSRDGSSETDSEGLYRVGGLEPGRYFVRAGYESKYLPELQGDVPCTPARCLPEDAAAIEAGLNTISRVDFALELGGVIHGRVTDVVTGEPLAGASVGVWTDARQRFGSGLADAQGSSPPDSPMSR